MVNPADSGGGVRPDDALLTAWLDGELTADEQAALGVRLKAEAALRERLDFLRRGQRAFAPAYDALLTAAPTDRLNAMLDSVLASQAAAPPLRRRWPWRAMAAAIAIFAAGGVAGYVLPDIINPQPAYPGWRQAVADYHSLISPATLAIIHSDPQQLAAEVTAIGGKLDLDLTPDRIALPNAMLKRTQLYDFRGMPLAQFVYDSSDVGPIAFCIITNGRDDAPPEFEERRGSSIVYWYKDGRGYMLIAQGATRAQLEAYAGDIARRFS